MPIFEIAALGAALSWAFASTISANPAKTLGALAFTRTRMIAALIMLIVCTSLIGTWGSLTTASMWPLIWSGIIGIFVGDTLLFLTMNRLGPRRTAIMFSINAPMSVVLGFVVLGETLSVKSLAGIVITISGVMLAIVYGKRKDQLHQWESVTGPLWLGVALGLGAALCQAIGALMVRPIMEAGVDPVAASTIRIGAAVIFLVGAAFLPIRGVKAQAKLTPSLIGQVTLSSFLGMVLGMTLILFALKGGQVGIVTTLSATTPALLLPILWYKTKEMPAIGAWVGAALVIIGSALIFNG